MFPVFPVQLQDLILYEGRQLHTKTRSLCRGESSEFFQPVNGEGKKGSAIRKFQIYPWFKILRRKVYKDMKHPNEYCGCRLNQFTGELSHSGPDPTNVYQKGGNSMPKRTAHSKKVHGILLKKSEWYYFLKWN